MQRFFAQSGRVEATWALGGFYSTLSNHSNHIHVNYIMASAESSFLLVGGADEEVRGEAEPTGTFSWRLQHVLGFLTGGTTFIAGTALLYPVQQTVLLASLSAALYTLGSLGFLFVDVQEFFSYTSPILLRGNILLSATGSLLYVLGSIGFFPIVFNASEVLGVWGFILGSLLIGVSQLFKLVRIGWRESGGFHPVHLVESKDSVSACGVEGGACLGAWFFFAGTLLLLLSPGAFGSVLLLWSLGSVSFTMGGACLAFRHFYLGIT
jgi:hypothetical protein